MKVGVLGAGGTIGPAIARDLAGSEEVSELLLLDLDEQRARAVAAAVDSGTASAARADARDPAALAAAIEGCELVVNSASYRLNLGVMQACLEAGCHYLDLGGLYWMTAEQIRSFAPSDGEDRFAQAGLLAVLGIGSSPGKTNLMAVRAMRELGAVDSLHVAAAGRDLEPPPGLSVPYSLRTLVDELSMPPVVVRDGEAVEIEPLSPGGPVDFGDPIGESDTIHSLHSELLTFPASFGCREVSFRFSLHPELLARLRELAAAPDVELRRAAAEAKPPSAHTVSVHLVDAAAGGRTVRVRSVTRPVDGLGLGGGVVSTASPAAAAVRLFARGRIASQGVLPPERCLDPDEMFDELEARGSAFDVEVREQAAA
jgi:lysine 6-dehydrogenase